MKAIIFSLILIVQFVNTANGQVVDSVRVEVPADEIHISNDTSIKQSFPNALQNWTAYELPSRKINKVAKIENTSAESGIVVITIKENREGNVVSAEGPAQGSTTLSKYLVNQARNAALACKFQPNPSAPEIETGSMTFHFKLK